LTEIPKYGTPKWFEMMFSTAEDDCDRWGHQWRASQKFRYQLALSLIQERLSQPQPKSILDIGCGLGDFTNMVHTINKKNSLFGLDISQNAITRAQNKYREIEFRCGALPSVDYPRKMFDGIVAMECIYYLTDQERKIALKNIFKRLKPQGWFLFSSPIDDGTRYFSDKRSKKLIENAGFRIHQIKYNYAKSYTKIEKPLVKLLQLSRIMTEISKSTDKVMLSRKKEILRRTLRITLFGFFFETLNFDYSFKLQEDFGITHAG
jgi:SAM-dependent methyltransferase